MSLHRHLQSGSTHVCRAWSISRRDGVVLGFTDHDKSLSFEGVEYAAETGLSALALQQVSGLAPDNTEAIGALDSEVLSAADIDAGLYDGAEVLAWQVQWDAPENRRLEFRGQIGTISRQGGSFTAELRGQTDALSQPGGRVFTGLCPHQLGSGACGVELSTHGFNAVIDRIQGASLKVTGLEDHEERLFERGALEVLKGPLKGHKLSIQRDEIDASGRVIVLWESTTGLAEGDQIRVVTGCDKRFKTCRERFGNAENFGGFPHIPGRDFLMAVPKASGTNDGGSLFGGALW